MSTTVKLKVQCSGCGGTGSQPLHPGGSVTCFLCEGEGKQIIGEFEIDPDIADILDRCNDILDKCKDILEAVHGSQVQNRQ